MWKYSLSLLLPSCFLVGKCIDMNSGGKRCNEFPWFLFLGYPKLCLNVWVELFVALVFCPKLGSLFVFMCKRGQISCPWMCFSIKKDPIWSTCEYFYVPKTFNLQSLHCCLMSLCTPMTKHKFAQNWSQMARLSNTLFKRMFVLPIILEHLFHKYDL